MIHEDEETYITRRGEVIQKTEDEVVSMLVCSTAHVTNTERRILNKAGYSRGEYGWLLYIGSAGDGVVPEIDKLSPGLEGAFLRAREHGCTYLLLDRDADRLDSVEAYEW